MRHYSKLTKFQDIAIKSIAERYPLDAVKLFFVSSFSVKETTLKYIYINENTLHLPLSDKTFHFSVSGMEGMIIKKINEELKHKLFIKEIKWY